MALVLPEGKGDPIREAFLLSSVDRLSGLVVIAPARGAGAPGSIPGPRDVFSLDFFLLNYECNYSSSLYNGIGKMLARSLFTFIYSPSASWRLFVYQFLALNQISLRLILILSCHLRLGLPKYLFPLGLHSYFLHGTTALGGSWLPSKEIFLCS